MYAHTKTFTTENTQMERKKYDTWSNGRNRISVKYRARFCTQVITMKVLTQT